LTSTAVPRGRAGHALTYATVAAANGANVEGTCAPGDAWDFPDLTLPGQRVGSTVLRLTRLTDIISPGPAARAVFIDVGQTPIDSGFYVYYLYPKWKSSSAPPIHHGDGATLSMADGHAEYWRWKGSETARIPRELSPISGSSFVEVLAERKDYGPQTEDGLYDLQRLQRATWGRLGYSTAKNP
jgi:prepilin-type processing-associated H-X9-DG protein